MLTTFPTRGSALQKDGEISRVHEIKDTSGVTKQIEIDEIYQKKPLERIPWNLETQPAELVALVDSHAVTPCRAIDLGCGAGNYAIYLGG